MSNICAKGVPNGAVGCIKAIERATHVGLIANDASSFASLEAALNINNYRVLIQETLKMFVFKKVHTFENTTSDPSITEPDISKTKLITDTSPLSYTFYLQSNFCDYKDVLKQIGLNANYTIVYFLQDGSVMMVDGLDGTVDGSNALVSAVSKGAQKEIENSFPLYVHHTNYGDLENAILLTPEWTVDDLLSYLPSGRTMRTVSKYDTSGGTVVVSVNERCGDGVASLTDADFEVVRSNVSTPAITTVAAVVGKTGQYTLTLDKESTPESLALGDEMVIQHKVEASSIVSYVSNELAIIVKS